MFNKTLKTSLIALVTVSSSAVAFADDFEILINNQDNQFDIFSNVDVLVNDSGDIISIDSSAIGNNFVISADEAAPLRVVTSQTSQSQNIVSLVNLSVKRSPETKVNSEAIANKAVIIANGDGENVVDNFQHNSGPIKQLPVHSGRDADPFSEVNVGGGVSENVNVTSRAGGNSAYFVLGGQNNVVTSRQRNDLWNETDNNIEVSENLSTASKGKTFGNSLTVIVGNIQPK